MSEQLTRTFAVLVDCANHPYMLLMVMKFLAAKMQL